MYNNRHINYMEYLTDKEIIIFGAGKIGKKVCRKLLDRNFKVIGFCDNNPSIEGDIIEDTIRSLGKLTDCQKLVNAKTVFIISSSYKEEMERELLDNGMSYINSDDIDFSVHDIEYYDADYFDWQKKIGEFTASFDSQKFTPYIKETDTVVEFGSGSGFLLKKIKAKNKIGIEINDFARKHSTDIGVRTVKSINMIENDYADVIISTHVLEHVDNPLGILRELFQKLKKGGKIVFIVPFEQCDVEYKRNDINQHLYTWNCLNLGNLFKRAGFFVKEVKSYSEQLPYGRGSYDGLFKETGENTLYIISEMFGNSVGLKNIMIIAEK